ncbi:DNA-binding helix-turn-helix protein [Lentilactobacillus kisonensis F0435]|uniref:DNA-binding helix-turn-helix protein n=2 Tax=Lentilactobacillus kisonensis TaxID=481722 RepID=H1LF24_9LACO|nr:DNA-binding helix-turn-helix protein [Lentilactobacillus kisonensis F0435]
MLEVYTGSENMTKGQRIAELRQSNKMSQSELAKAIKVSPSTIGMWETDQRAIKDNDLISLANIFNVTVDYLLGNTTSKHGKAPEWANDQDKKDLKVFLEENSNDMTFGGEGLSDEEREQVRRILEGFFWEKQKRKHK